ncbi:unnamed protein product [Adineta steineri]|uniref:palmitoyl-protein hydrolase n=1 Tax=Adineta steineri TaxID=433720 RepID=A0A814U6Q3_9BILA|nr:unnamed protein product [Adineta steineri]CAF3725027.1 unnamed protein product [Adineta steineri]
MLVLIEFIFISTFLIISQVSSQNQFNSSITCYTRYESEDTILKGSNTVIGHQYHQTETTRYDVANEPCSKIGCACFSYQSACSSLSRGSNHVSRCTDIDRQNGTIKWHHGWTSYAKCEEMMRQPQIYHSLTCCYTDRCNTQPGKTITFVDMPNVIPIQSVYGHAPPQSVPDSHISPQQYETNNYPSQQSLPDSHRSEHYDPYGYPWRQPLPVQHNPPQQHDTYDHAPQQPSFVTHKPPPQPQQQYDTNTQPSPQRSPVSNTPPQELIICTHPSTLSSRISRKTSPRLTTHTRLPDQRKRKIVAWGTNLLFFMATIGLAIFGSIFYRSLSRVSSPILHAEKKIVKSIQMNKPSAIIPASDKHTASFIFFHGLGDVGESWLQAFKFYKIPKDMQHVKFIFPTAPIRKITLNNGHPMTGWFDAFGLNRSAKEDQEGILESSKYFNDLIQDEIDKGIPAERIIIGGFSQGGAAALHATLTTPHVLAGVLALSTWLPLSSTFPQALVSGDKKVNLPILQCHGNKDPVVEMRWGQMTEELFKSMGFKQYKFKEYQGMVHTSNDEEIKDVVAFINQHLPKTNT